MGAGNSIQMPVGPNAVPSAELSLDGALKGDVEEKTNKRRKMNQLPKGSGEKQGEESRGSPRKGGKREGE